MRILTIVNPTAARGKPLRLRPKLEKRLLETPHVFDWKVTKTAEEMRQLIRSAGSRGTDAILLIGGDGTVHEALPAILQAGLPFGIIPCGRGNDFARNIGLSLDIDENCQWPVDLRATPIDLPLVNGQPFGSIACVGFDALVNRLARDKTGQLGGTAGYIVCVLKALRIFHPLEVEVKVDDFVWRGKAMMVAVANGPYYGGGMKIAPQARMDDGLFDVCLIQEVSKAELIREFPKVFRGTHTRHPAVLIRSGRMVKISGPDSEDVFADGELAGHLPAVCSLSEKKIAVLRPGVIRREAQEGI
jgi:diacylglycerol kinase (ATP)